MPAMRSGWVIVAIMAGAALLRLGLLARAWDDPRRLLTPDSHGYMGLAVELSQNGRFELDGRCEISRTPGYPLFLLMAVPLGHGWWRAIAAPQVAVDVAAVYLVYVLGCLVCRRGVGYLAAGLYTVSPLAVSASLRILSDGLFTFLLLFAVLMLAFHLRSWRWWALVAGAVAMGIGSYVRPVGLAYGAVVAVVLLTQPRRLRRTGMFVAVLALVAAPWVIRNLARADYAGFSSFATDSLYYFGAPEIVAAREDIPADQAREQARRAGRQLDEELAPGPAARARAEAAMRLVASQPLLYTRQHLAGTLGFWLPAANDVLEIAGRCASQRGTLDVLHTEGLRAAVEHYFGSDRLAMALAAGMTALLGFLYLGVLLWLANFRAWRGKPEAYLGLALVLAAALMAGPSALPRYRLPVLPLLCVAAAAGYLALREAFIARRKSVRA
jgi:4-amino-4-deoxy-L-arabinose transferase-like glycosyltransferase